MDNAVAESFNSTLEFELLSQQHFSTREQARRAVAAWIDEYNTVRRHSTDLMLSPVDFERRQDRTQQGRGVSRQRGDAPRRLRARPSGAQGSLRDRSATASGRP